MANSVIIPAPSIAQVEGSGTGLNVKEPLLSKLKSPR